MLNEGGSQTIKNVHACVEEGGIHNQREKWAYTTTTTTHKKEKFNGKCSKMWILLGSVMKWKPQFFPIHSVLLVFGRFDFDVMHFYAIFKQNLMKNACYPNPLSLIGSLSATPIFIHSVRPRFKMRQYVKFIPAAAFQTIKSLILKMHVATSYLLWFHLLPLLSRVICLHPHPLSNICGFHPMVCFKYHLLTISAVQKKNNRITIPPRIVGFFFASVTFRCISITNGNLITNGCLITVIVLSEQYIVS